MQRTLLLIFGFILLLGKTFSQDMIHEEPGHDHHEHHRHEIGMGNTIVYFLNEEELAYGLHVHYIYNFRETIFGIGLGYERIFDEHGHNAVGIIGNIRPVDAFSITLMPGLGFEDHEPSEMYFVLHLEALYEFSFGDFHIGPTVGFGYDPEDIHLGAGIHIGYGF